MSKMETTNFSHGVGQNSYHLVWKPKYSWNPFKFPWVKKDCETIFKEAVTKYGLKLYELSQNNFPYLIFLPKSKDKKELLFPLAKEEKVAIYIEGL
jgi:REP element-mobilizing transposase RayT